MNPITPAELAAYFDHTQLRAYAQRKDFEKLCAEAREYGFAMVAINPAPVSLCKDLLAGTSVHVGAAVGFPLGQSTPKVKKYETVDAIANGADEIDYVINITQLKEKNYDFIEHEMAGIVEECRGAGVISKVIFENCYLTEEEKAQFVEGYLSEGDFGEDDSIKIFPVAKSTELLFLNDTDWQAFADAAGVRYEDLATMEGLTAAAEKYYNWTDAQTAAPDDGKALFGRDAMANYMLVGAQQLGDTIFAVKDGRMTVNFERDVARRLWDNYYVPFVKGWFAATGRFRSDDIKTGNVLAYVDSSSSATFFPTRVTNDANQSHEISLKTLPAPQFEGGEAVAVQQGAGMVVTAAKEEEVKASVEFLKWFVRAENNIAFSVGSGYLPVTRKANDMQEILASGLTLDDNMQQTLAVAVDTVNGNRLYTPHAFAGGSSARKVLEYGLSDLAAADRETVVQRIAEGQSAAEAEAEFLTDEYFEAWYQDICAKLAQYEG